MTTSDQNIEALNDIRRIMERSGRFISLSGWSGIAAGLCGLIGAGLATRRLNVYFSLESPQGNACPNCLKKDLMLIAAGVFIIAFASAVLFTFLKSKKEGTPVWGEAAQRLLWNSLIPMIVGGFLICRMMELEYYDLMAPSSLIFYGLGLINGSKYTMGEVRYLGYAEVVTGIAGLWANGSGLYLWAFGFGILHIIYGIAMWWKYERDPIKQDNSEV